MSPRCWPPSARGGKAKYRSTAAAWNSRRLVVVEEAPRDRAVIYQYLVGLAYLAIGLFVYFRRGSAHKARHFYVLCLASFIFLLLPLHRQAERLRQDHLLRQRAGGPAGAHPVPALLPHVSRSRASGSAGRARVALLYVPAALLFLALPGFRLRRPESRRIPLVEVRWLLDRAWMVLCDRCPTWPAALALAREYRKAEDPIVRQQLKWLRNGALLRLPAVRPVLRAAVRRRRDSERIP